MRLRILNLLVLSCIASSASCQVPVLLHDGQHITITGTLTPEPAGRLQFIAIKTNQFYVPVMPSDGAEHRGEPTHDISLSDYHDYTALYAHRGERVTATGIVSTDSASPYYLHNLRLAVRTLRGAQGENLLLQTAPPARIAVDTGMYQATAILPADPAAPWQYSVPGSSTRADGMISCSSNGGGDVVNCFCAEGFHASQAHMLSKGNETKGDLMENAQFQMPENEVTGEVHLSITCSR